MRVLLSTIGSRGEVQPICGLGVRLLARGHSVVVCAPPDFRDLVSGFGLEFTPVGRELRSTAAPGERPTPTPEEMRRQLADTVADQFRANLAAADGCDVLVAGGGLNFGLHSVAEKIGARYVYAAFCAISLPSAHHAPPAFGGVPRGTGSNVEQWGQDAALWNARFLEHVNDSRAGLGLAPIDDVRSHVFTSRPWLAADPVLGPWPGDLDVLQTGAWSLDDPRPLPPELSAFLDAGEPPVYFGFGSMKAPEDLAEVVIRTSRWLGRRAVVSRGWAGVSLAGAGDDFLSVGEVNHRALFARCAAVVHHGGAGTTTTAAAAGVPQVLVPQMFDQPYWAAQVERLGIGAAHAPGAPTVASMTDALERALATSVVARAREVGGQVRTDGADVTAGLLTG